MSLELYVSECCLMIVVCASSYHIKSQRQAFRLTAMGPH